MVGYLISYNSEDTDTMVWKGESRCDATRCAPLVLFVFQQWVASVWRLTHIALPFKMRKTFSSTNFAETDLGAGIQQEGTASPAKSHLSSLELVTAMSSLQLCFRHFTVFSFQLISKGCIFNLKCPFFGTGQSREQRNTENSFWPL